MHCRNHANFVGKIFSTRGMHHEEPYWELYCFLVRVVEKEERYKLGVWKMRQGNVRGVHDATLIDTPNGRYWHKISTKYCWVASVLSS